MANVKKLPLSFKVLLVAGIIGGLSEIIWVLVYTQFSNLSAATVATQITKTFIPNIAAGTTAIILGILIHFILSIALLLLLVKSAFSRLSHNRTVFPKLMLLSVALLTLVWAFNFFILLPYINPAFVNLLPYEISLASKVMFGITMGLTLSLLFSRRSLSMAKTRRMPVM